MCWLYEPSYLAYNLLILLTCSLSDNNVHDDGIKILVEALLVNCKDIKDVK